MCEQLVIFKQCPIIEFSEMEERGLEVALDIKELNLDTIKPTESNRSMMKKMRAKLNNELSVFEEQRKMIHGLITQPYKDFTDSYDKNIKVLYVDATAKLKDKIATVEVGMLNKKTDDIKAYFNSKNSHSFLTIDNAGLNIILSATDKKLEEQVNDFVVSVDKDVSTIQAMDNSVRIMSIYENTLDLSGSVAKVLADIKEEKRLEAERLKRDLFEREQAKKQAEQNRIDAEKQAKERAERKEIEAKELEQKRIQAEKNAKLNKTKEAEAEAKRIAKEQLQAEQDAIDAKAESERLKIEKQERKKQEAEANKIHKMSFKVSGTIGQLKQIKSFLEEIGVNYE